MAISERIRIPLHAKDGTVRAHTLIDSCDADLARVAWSLQSRGYVQRGTGPRSDRRILLLHRVILGLGFGDRRQVDHINGDRLDNRRANLRVVTAAQNAQNRRGGYGASSHRGVTPSKDRWEAYAKLNGRRHYLGRFETELQAAAVASAFRQEHMTHTNEAVCGPAGGTGYF